MNTILFLVQKEFIQIFRNKILKALIFLVPFVQLIILVNAATFELKNTNVVFVDLDNSETSNKLISKFKGSRFFTVIDIINSDKKANDMMMNNYCDLIINIPNGFEKQVIKENDSKILLTINGINGVKAGIIIAYSNNLIQTFNKNIITENLNIIRPTNPKVFNINFSHWYNPELEYKSFMVPGILVLLVTMIGLYLTSMNTVREKELGNIEQINVTPIKKYQFIAGKLIPFWLIALFELAFGLALGKLLYDIPIVGDLKIIFLFAILYLPTVLGIGLFISTVTQTQLQAMMLSMPLNFIFILMSGLFTPIESMPNWAQQFNILNPIAYYIKVMRMVLIKGSGLNDLSVEFISIMIYSIIVLSLSIWKYRKTA